MLFSRCNFFNQNKNILEHKRYDVYNILLLKGYNRNQVDIYLKAYDYFTDNPNDFDGATFVKDLCDIPGLDLDAMLHDYQYLIYNVGSNIKLKILTDWLYAKGQERKGKSQYASYTRLFGLVVLLGPIIIIRSKIKYGPTSKKQIDNFLIDYNVLIKNKHHE